VSVQIDELTGNEQAVLLVLMAECRPVPNPELAQLGPKLEVSSRTKLKDRGLIDVTAGRPMVVELTDSGWQICAQIIRAGVVPPKPSSQGKTLYTLLRSLHRYFTQRELVPADVFGPAADEEPHGARPRPAAIPTVSTVEEQVRGAYDRLVVRPGGWVGLAQLRNELAHIPRADLDAVLRQLYRTPGVTLIPEENQKVITADDRAAAIEIGDQDKHLIAVQA
jgi:hypothetical protein